MLIWIDTLRDLAGITAGTITQMVVVYVQVV